VLQCLALFWCGVAANEAKKCGVAVIKNFAMCGVYIILHAVYGDVKTF